MNSYTLHFHVFLIYNASFHGHIVNYFITSHVTCLLPFMRGLLANASYPQLIKQVFFFFDPCFNQINAQNSFSPITITSSSHILVVENCNFVANIINVICTFDANHISLLENKNSLQMINIYIETESFSVFW